MRAKWPIDRAARPLLIAAGMDFTDFSDEILPHAPILLRLARRMSPHDAEDLVQETFMRALAARHRYRPGTNARAWLCRILANLAISGRRKEARDRRLQTRIAEVSPSSLPSPADDARADHRRIRLAIAALSDAERRLIELADVEGMRYREIARVLDCPLGTVMSRLHRARRRLQQAAAQPAPRREQTAIHCAAA